MNNDQKNLSKMLQGMNMGINAYEKYIDNLHGRPKKQMEEFLQEHKRQKVRLEYIADSKGYDINNTIGIGEKVSEAYENIKLKFKNDPKDIIKDAYRGEIMGAVASQGFLNEFSESIRPDIEKILNEDKVIIEKIHDMLIEVKTKKNKH